MRSLYVVALLLLAFVSPVLAAPVDTIRWPVAPQPAPAPLPNDISKLVGEQLYVIDSDVPLIVLSSPAGLVKITEDAGPMKIRGKFVDGAGKTETRTFKGKAIYTVEAVATGRVELIVVPVGATKEADVIRKTIDVDAGLGPIPPPKPPVPPKPPEPPEPVTSFRVLFVYESGATLTTAQNSVLYAKSVSDWLTANCTKEGVTAGWRRWDKDAVVNNDTVAMKALWAAVKPQVKPTDVPCVVVEVNGKAEILPLPATPEEAVALFAKYKGGR